MKNINVVRWTVLSVAVLGTVLTVTSQPGVSGVQQGPLVHSIIPAKVPMSQVQEFKDAASIHLNDLQKGNRMASGTSSRMYFTERVISNYVYHYLIYLDAAQLKGGATGAATAVQKLTPAEVAMLAYTFDEGMDIMSRNPASKASAIATPSHIEASISQKDMGMTDPQFRQMVMQYLDNHPLRFWNQARVGLASGR